MRQASPLNTLRKPASPPHLWTRNLLALPLLHCMHRHLGKLLLVCCRPLPPSKTRKKGNGII